MQVRLRRSGSGTATPTSARTEYHAAASALSSALTSAYVTPDASPTRASSRAGSVAPLQDSSATVVPASPPQLHQQARSLATGPSQQHTASRASQQPAEEASITAAQSVHGGSLLQQLRAERQISSPADPASFGPGPARPGQSAQAASRPACSGSPESPIMLTNQVFGVEASSSSLNGLPAAEAARPAAPIMPAAHHHQSSAAVSLADGGHIRSPATTSRTPAPATPQHAGTGSQPAVTVQGTAGGTSQSVPSSSRATALGQPASMQTQHTPAAQSPASQSEAPKPQPQGGSSRYQRVAAPGAALPASRVPAPLQPIATRPSALGRGIADTASPSATLKAGLDSLNSLLSTVPGIKPKPASSQSSAGRRLGPGPVTESIEDSAADMAPSRLERLLASQLRAAAQRCAAPEARQNSLDHTCHWVSPASGAQHSAGGPVAEGVQDPAQELPSTRSHRLTAESRFQDPGASDAHACMLFLSTQPTPSMQSDIVALQVELSHGCHLHALRAPGAAWPGAECSLLQLSACRRRMDLASACKPHTISCINQDQTSHLDAPVDLGLSRSCHMPHTWSIQVRGTCASLLPYSAISSAGQGC